MCLGDRMQKVKSLILSCCSQTSTLCSLSQTSRKIRDPFVRNVTRLQPRVLAGNRKSRHRMCPQSLHTILYSWGYDQLLDIFSFACKWCHLLSHSFRYFKSGRSVLERVIMRQQGSYLRWKWKSYNSVAIANWKDATHSWMPRGTPRASTKALRCTQGAPTSAFPQATPLWSSIGDWNCENVSDKNHSTGTGVLTYIQRFIAWNLKLHFVYLDWQGME